MKKLKVNLGSGTDYMPGWVNVDAERQYNPDILADLSKPFPFRDNSVSEIKASDILEHFTKEDGERFLQECYRVLEVGGIITIRTHNIFQIFRQFKNDPYVLIHFLYGNTKDTGIFGAHKYAYTNDMIQKTLKRIGLSIQSIHKESTNFVIIAKKEKQKSKKKLHIAVIQQTPDVGGAETYMKSLMGEFLNQGVAIDFATNNKKFITFTSDLPIKTQKIPVVLDIIGNYKGLIKSILRLPYAFYFYTGLLRKYKKEGVNIILMSGFSEKMLVSFLTLFIKIPVVWIEYGPLKSIFTRNFRIPKVIYRLLKSIPQYVIVPSKNTMQSMVTDCRISISKLVEIPCGVKMQLGKVAPISEYKGKVVIGNVSRLTKEKGQEILIRAAALIKKKKPNVIFLIIGEGPDKTYYQKLIDSLHLEDNVKLLGYVEDLNNYYESMDLFVFPTVWNLEGFGVVLPEAMVHKLPIVASNFGPVPEIVKNGVNGIVVEPNNYTSLANAIIELINNSKKRDTLGQNGYKLTKEKYNISDISSKFLELLNYASE